MKYALVARHGVFLERKDKGKRKERERKEKGKRKEREKKEKRKRKERAGDNLPTMHRRESNF